MPAQPRSPLNFLPLRVMPGFIENSLDMSPPWLRHRPEAYKLHSPMLLGVDDRPRFVIEASRTASCDPEAIMAMVRDATSWPAWQPEIVATAGSGRLEVGDVVEGRARMLGFDVHGRAHAERSTETGFSEDVIVGVRMRVHYDVMQRDGRTIVTARLETRLPTGLSGRVLSVFLKRRLARMQKIALERLVAQAEASAP